MSILMGCGSWHESSRKATLSAFPKDEVLLVPDSSKREMIVEQVVGLGLAPMMESLAGKIAFDESVIVRISATVVGRIVLKVPVLGVKVSARDLLIELDSSELGRCKTGSGRL